MYQNSYQAVRALGPEEPDPNIFRASFNYITSKLGIADKDVAIIMGLTQANFALMKGRGNLRMDRMVGVVHALNLLIDARREGDLKDAPRVELEHLYGIKEYV